MRKLLTAARGFPTQRVGEIIGAKGNQQQIVNSAEVLGQRSGKLVRGGQVDKAVAPVVRRSVIYPGRYGISPFSLSADFENRNFGHFLIVLWNVWSIVFTELRSDTAAQLIKLKYTRIEDILLIFQWDVK